jgi:hypothetical protein
MLLLLLLCGCDEKPEMNWSEPEKVERLLVCEEGIFEMGGLLKNKSGCLKKGALGDIEGGEEKVDVNGICDGDVKEEKTEEEDDDEEEEEGEKGGGGWRG